MGTVEELGKLGTPQGAFSQCDFRGTATVREGVNITGGYCAGVALDWCRRALLSGANRAQASLNYGSDKYNEPLRKDATVKRMAKGYAEQGKPYVAQTNLEKVKALLPQLLLRPECSAMGIRPKGVQLTEDEAKLLASFWQFDNTRIDFGKAVAGQFPKSHIQALIQSAASLAENQHQALAGGGRSWSNMAQVMDARFNELRGEVGRAVTKRPFGGIRVKKSKDVTSYTEEGYWAYELDGAYDVGCCTLISLSPLTVGGHAVAVFRRENNLYDFFDPNYGVFRMSLANLGNCFQHLFWSSMYTYNPPSDHSQLAVYRRPDSPDGSPNSRWLKMGYTVFEKVPD